MNCIVRAVELNDLIRILLLFHFDAKEKQVLKVKSQVIFIVPYSDASSKTFVHDMRLNPFCLSVLFLYVQRKCLKKYDLVFNILCVLFTAGTSSECAVATSCRPAYMTCTFYL